MAAIHELLSRVDDEELRAKLEEEFNKLSKQKKFGLVFEEHLPECTPLFDMPIKRGSVSMNKRVVRKNGLQLFLQLLLTKICQIMTDYAENHGKSVCLTMA